MKVKNGWLQDLVWLRCALTGTSVAFSPDGQLLVTTAGFGFVQIYRVSDGSLVWDLKGHTGSVFSVAFSPDGQFLASGGEDRLALWSVRAPKMGFGFARRCSFGF